MEDGAVRIFLNTRGVNRNEVSEELVEFLHYVEHTNDDTIQCVESERIKRIHQRVQIVKTSEEAGVRYMQAWEEKYYDRQEAREQGLEEGREEGREEGLKAFIIVLVEENFEREKILEKLRVRFGLSQEEAEAYYARYSTES